MLSDWSAAASNRVCVSTPHSPEDLAGGQRQAAHRARGCAGALCGAVVMLVLKVRLILIHHRRLVSTSVVLAVVVGRRVVLVVVGRGVVLLGWFCHRLLWQTRKQPGRW